MNRLRYEKSPYLLQHADNPVDWMPWSYEAFDEARKKDKPVFLSIGYSTCHWCHVMERESFVDPDVASLLNRVFVCIKVDREERPDIDKLYMNMAQMITGRGGWPLSIFMTPDKKPFFAATYIPKKDRPGQVGLLTLVPKIGELWNNKRDEILGSASGIVDRLDHLIEGPGTDIPGENIIDRAFRDFSGIYDRQFGGFGSPPKFPSTHNLSFLLRYWKKTGQREGLDMVTNTLDHMRSGGIWDHAGYGFHRYSTDRKWMVPHFEKMLYDQAMICDAYLDAYQATGEVLYRETSEMILQYVKDHMTSDNGGFYAAEDADSEGMEGRFYLWKEEELRAALTESEFSLTESVFNIKSRGNYSDESSGNTSGYNILYFSETPEELSASTGMDEASLKEKLQGIIKKLYKIREKRVRPFRDEKILADWNGLMISSFARGGAVLGRPEYIDIAAKAARFILENMSTKEGRLFHNHSGGQASIDANLDDYSFMIMALLELYQATFDYSYIEKAVHLDSVLDRYFWDNKKGGYFFTPSDNEDLIFRQKEIYDGAIPSGNSISMLNLLKLGRINMDNSLTEKASAIARAFSGTVSRTPTAYSQFLTGLDFMLGRAYEIILVRGEDKGVLENILQEINSRYIPNKVIIVPHGGVKMPEFIMGLKAIDNRTTAYICRDYYCELPTSDISMIMKLLGTE